MPARPSENFRWLRPGTLAVGVSVLLHAVLFSAALFVPEPEPERARLGIDACRFDGEPSYIDWPEPAEMMELAEERSDVFRFAETEPESEPAEPATLPSAGTAPTANGPGSPSNPGSIGTGTDRGGTSTGSNLFHAAGGARSVVFAIDCSLSMGLRGALETAKRELMASLESLPATMRFQVIFYNRDAQPLAIGGCRELLPASAAVRREMTALISETRASGSTDHLGAIRQALSLRPEVIYLATDADDLTAELVREVTRLNRSRAVIHAIDLAAGRPEGDRALRDLAARNRGTYRAAQR